MHQANERSKQQQQITNNIIQFLASIYLPAPKVKPPPGRLLIDSRPYVSPEGTPGTRASAATASSTEASNASPTDFFVTSPGGSSSSQVSTVTQPPPLRRKISADANLFASANFSDLFENGQLNSQFFATGQSSIDQEKAVSLLSDLLSQQPPSPGSSGVAVVQPGSALAGKLNDEIHSVRIVYYIAVELSLLFAISCKNASIRCKGPSTRTRFSLGRRTTTWTWNMTSVRALRFCFLKICIYLPL